MPRKTLAQINSGRDPSVLAQNVRRRRLECGFSMRELARRAEVHYVTISQVEKGLGCTPAVEFKLSQALQVSSGFLWIPRPSGLQYVMRPHEECRWYFVREEEGKKIMQAHDLFDEVK